MASHGYYYYENAFEGLVKVPLELTFSLIIDFACPPGWYNQETLLASTQQISRSLDQQRV